MSASNFTLSRSELGFAQVQSAFGAIPNSGGTATVGNSNAFRLIKMVLDPIVGTITRQDKTGSRSRTPGTFGRMNGKWSMEASMAPNGTAGVAPDHDPFLQGLFGHVPVLGSGTATLTAATAAAPIVCTTSGAHGLTDMQATFISGCDNLAANGACLVHVTDGTHFEIVGSDGTGQTVGTTGTVSKAVVKYALDDTIIPFCAWSFRQPSTIDQRVAFDCVVNTATFNLGQDGAATFSMDGEAAWVLSKNRFANVAVAAQKGGLSAFPSQPSTPVTNGGIIAGFTGNALFKGAKLAGLRTASVNIGPANAPVKDTFGSFIPTGAEGDVRNVTTQFSIYEDDSTAFKDLCQAAEDKTAIETVYQIGTVAGSTVILHCQGVQLIPPSREEQRRYIANFPAAPCNGSSLTAKNEVTMWIC